MVPAPCATLSLQVPRPWNLIRRPVTVQTDGDFEETLKSPSLAEENAGPGEVFEEFRDSTSSE
jgi:hypothetical protein